MTKICFTKRQITILAILVILLYPCLSNQAYSAVGDETKNVLLINSYHEGFAWTKDVTDGIIGTLDSGNYNISTFVEYMDWKNYPTDENLEYLYEYFKYKYQNKGIDILITTDDVALEFALEHREDLFSNAPIVFCGVNQKGIDQITKGYKNYTGVLEEIDPTDTIEMALSINPSLKNIYIVFDNSSSGISAGELVINKINTMYTDLNTIPLNNLSYDELIRDVRSYGEDSIILFITYYTDIGNKIMEFEYVSREISENSSVPVYHLYDLGLNNGAFGGSMADGGNYGKYAADLAIRILEGENPNNIPISYPKASRRVLDYQQLKRFNIPLNRIPKDCELINKPFSFFETYNEIVWAVSTAFVVLIIFVCVLLIHINKIKRMERSLSENHKKLTQIYEELEDSDKELKEQYDEIVKINEKLKMSEEKLAYLAYHDALTGLPNKLSLYEDTKNTLFISRNSMSSLFFLDIDNFKYINDTMGHDFGDRILTRVSERLLSLLKEDCYIYRLSGDEFIIIIDNIRSKQEAEDFAVHILDGFKEEFEVSHSILHVGLSIGIAIFPEQGENLQELLKYSNIAMYKAKETGRNKYVLYNQKMNEAFVERVNIERHLRKALEKNEFQIYYQPQIDLNSSKITGFEALLRWENSQLGFVSPLKFIEAAENTHMIIPIGAWVLRNACAFLKQLHNKGYTDLTISVNVSIIQLLQTDFNNIVINTLEVNQLEPEYLELEITESIMMESYDMIAEKLEKLRNKGIKIALDDFGKGYSSLCYLKQLPISTLKMDKSFIDDIQGEGAGKTLAGQIVLLGKRMGMCVIAEGVERQEQLKYLVEHQCPKAQGYIFSEPIPEWEVEEILEKINGTKRNLIHN